MQSWDTTPSAPPHTAADTFLDAIGFLAVAGFWLGVAVVFVAAVLWALRFLF